MVLDLQPTLQNELVKIVPIQAGDFERLYQVASDPLIWEQHPNRNRYEREVFQLFFDEALKSKGAFLVLDAKTNELIGSSRYYDIFLDQKSIAVGYTFLARTHWGGSYNWALKTLMLDHAFQAFDTVVLHIGESNIRSQKGTEKLGAVKVGEVTRTNYGTPITTTNFIYHLPKAIWEEKKKY
jgi:RimJ/RimL family protein N-acetyltransferase